MTELKITRVLKYFTIIFGIYLLLLIIVLITTIPLLKLLGV